MKLAGESEGGGKRCEGEAGCAKWQMAAGTYEEKLETVIPGCEKNCSPPWKENEEEPTDEINDLVDLIEALAQWEDAGIATDWSCYGFAEMALFRIWREAENFVHRQQQARIQVVVQGWMTSGTET